MTRRILLALLLILAPTLLLTASLRASAQLTLVEPPSETVVGALVRMGAAAGGEETISCVAAVTSPSGGVSVLRSSGSGEAIIEFVAGEVGVYRVNMTCTAGNETVSAAREVSVAPPQLSLSPPSAPYGVPFTLVVRVENAPNGYSAPATVRVGERRYSVVLEGGVASVSVPALFSPSVDVSVEIYSYVYSTTMSVAPPSVSAPDSVTIKESRGAVVTVTAVKADGSSVDGYLDAYTDSDACRVVEVHNIIDGAGEIVVRGEREGDCTLYYTAVFPGGVTAGGAVSVSVVPINVSVELSASGSDAWNKTFTAVLTQDVAVRAVLEILVDGEVLGERAANASTITLSVSVELYPGEHTVEVRAVSDYYNLSRTMNITAPRHPYPFSGEDVPRTIRAGEELDIPLPHSIYAISNSTLYVYVSFPGDDYYAPLELYTTVRVVEPSIQYYKRNSTLVIRDALPGAHVTVKCGAEKIVEETISTSTYKHRIAGCSLAVVEYTAGWYSAVRTLENPISISIVKRAVEGVPTVVVSADPAIVAVMVDGAPYTPGSRIALQRGEHLVEIVLRGGLTVHETIYVESNAHYKLSNTTITIASTTNTLFDIVLSDGTILRVPPGTYTLPLPPLAVYYAGTTVEVPRG